MTPQHDKYLSFGPKYVYENHTLRDIYISNVKTHYAVADSGAILNTNTYKFLKRTLRTDIPDLYMQFSIFIDYKKYIFSVHRLVALAFIPTNEDTNMLEVNHKDYNKSNNHVDNLEWVTKSENILYSINTRNPRVPIADSDTIHKICELLEQNELSVPQIAKKLKVHTKLVYCVLQKRNWRNISSQYDIDNYTRKTTRELDEDVIRYICKCLEENNMTVKEISISAGVPKNTVHQIIYRRAYTDISKDYNIDNYDTTGFVKIYSDETIRRICELLVENKLTPLEISKETGVPINYVRQCLRHEKRTNITNEYDFSHYNKCIERNLYDNDLKQELDKLIVDGYSNSEIRDLLNIEKNKTTKSFINNHRNALRKKYKKLGLEINF